MDWNGDMIGDLNDPDSINNVSSASLPATFGSLDSGMSFDPFLNVDPSNPLVDWTTIGGVGEPLERSHSSGSNYLNNVGMDGLNSGMSLDRSPYAAIAQLSQLSTRLYPLHQSGCVLAETAAASFSGNRSQQRPLLDESCLKSVASWFVHLFARVPLQILSVDYGTKNTGEILQSVFSASHHMMEILCRLQNEPSSFDSSRGETGAGLPHGPIHSGQGNNDKFNALNVLNPAGHYSHDTIICHLVIACHTLLLNIYVAVLVALQHDVDLRSSFLLPTKCTGYLEGETQLVMVVQLCAYLLERQRQAVDIYFTPSPPSPPPPTAQMMTPPTTPPTANREVVSHLETDIRQRLTRIRQALRI
ncbi:uncharacterized protein RCC_12216 [Ramularia collo-cygni]|uniref:Aflatoxin regulatory protein domain-containing protein n=1 Tax=Ramularia collo-cygni TaxID=112498 RepID=A0A2D3US16_9PEZI|nr:uncharacterized protein RCC_12216 [Ramularia collo-cygni]CZT17478.1 uncharacterized protein RCC_12216 [Ramularia collo-cygni]